MWKSWKCSHIHDFYFWWAIQHGYKKKTKENTLWAPIKFKVGVFKIEHQPCQLTRSRFWSCTAVSSKWKFSVLITIKYHNIRNKTERDYLIPFTVSRLDTCELSLTPTSNLPCTNLNPLLLSTIFEESPFLSETASVYLKIVIIPFLPLPDFSFLI